MLMTPGPQSDQANSRNCVILGYFVAYCIRKICSISLKLKSKVFALLPAYFKQLDTNVLLKTLFLFKLRNERVQKDTYDIFKMIITPKIND